MSYKVEKYFEIAVIKYDDGCWDVICPPLHIIAFGRNFKEALKKFGEVIQHDISVYRDADPDSLTQNAKDIQTRCKYYFNSEVKENNITPDVKTNCRNTETKHQRYPSILREPKRS